ncbi:hypothetical protein B9Z55_020824 [Caenorhabditis nigoni]|uniref:F-box domain-containing protein n=1 Tax=Caenorhabditis nigoni TaxID=1611254 RepID=A0A2G5TPB0_9PELO|nr:hypothetical protein B9Z55_020824 [Caenorhabditis nigoni]
MNCFLDVFRCVSKRRSVSPINLIDMPELVIEKILENLDFHSILNLRKVCHDLRDFVHHIKPSSHLTNIFIHVQSKLIAVELYFPSGPKSFDGQQTFYIDYHKTGNGCGLEFYKATKYEVRKVRRFFENEDFVTTAMNHLKILMNHQKAVLEFFRLEIEYYPNLAREFDRNMEPIAKEFLGEFKKILESRRSQIQVENFQMAAIRQDQVDQILPLVDSKVLQNIEVEKDNPMASFRMNDFEKFCHLTLASSRNRNSGSELSI